MSVEARVDMLLRVVADCDEDRMPASEPHLRVRLDDPAVEATVRTAADAGLLAETPRGWALTDSGRRRATSAVRRHRTIEAFLAQVLGIAWADVHAEACRWERVAGDIVVAKMARRLRDRLRSPYGGPIPRADEKSPTASAQAASLAELVEPTPRPLRLVRVGEVLQDDAEELPRLAAAGCFPGIEVVASCVDDGDAVVDAPGGTVRLRHSHARALFVEPIG